MGISSSESSSCRSCCGCSEATITKHTFCQTLQKQYFLNTQFMKSCPRQGYSKILGAKSAKSLQNKGFEHISLDPGPPPDFFFFFGNVSHGIFSSRSGANPRAGRFNGKRFILGFGLRGDPCSIRLLQRGDPWAACLSYSLSGIFMYLISSLN